MTAWLATLVAGVVTAALAVIVWRAPAAADASARYVYGGLQGVWAVDWITFWGLMIFNTLVLTGDFDSFKRWLIHHATSDVRIQTLMLAWAFGALLEGLVGFGYPVGGRRADSDRRSASPISTRSASRRSPTTRRCRTARSARRSSRSRR